MINARDDVRNGQQEGMANAPVIPTRESVWDETPIFWGAGISGPGRLRGRCGKREALAGLECQAVRKVRRLAVNETAV